MAMLQGLASTSSAEENDLDAFLAQRLRELHADLVQECDRITVARQLYLEKELQKVKQQSKELLQKNQLLVKRAAITGFQIDSDQADEDIQSKSEQYLTLGCSESSRPSAPQDDGTQLSLLVSLKSAEASAETHCNFDTNTLEAMPLQDSESTIAPMALVSDLGGRVSKNVVCLDDNSTTSFDSGQGSTAPSTSKPCNQSRLRHFDLWTEWKGKASTMIGLLIDDDFKATHSIRELELFDQTSPVHKGINSVVSRCTLAPTSTCALIWEMVGIPLLFYDLITIPMQVFYDLEDVALVILAWAVVMYWTVDMSLRLLVFGYVTGHGEVHFDRRQIIKHYLRTSFCFDLAMVAPDWLNICFGLPRNAAFLRAFRMIRLMKIMRMTKLQQFSRKFQDSLDSEYYVIICKIFSNLAAIVACCHYCACAWFWLGDQEISGYRSWVETWQLQDVPWEYQYALSLFWAITQVTPGSSQVQPQNVPECLFVSMVLIFGMVFFSLFVSHITQERMCLNALTSKLDRDNWTLRKYLRQHDVSKDLTIRAIKYADSCVVPLMQQVQRKDVELLNYLSKPLQLEVQAELLDHTLSAHPFLRRLRKYSWALSSHLFNAAVTDVWLADTDILFTFGQVSHEMYFLKKGKLAYLFHGTNEIRCIKPGAWCCEPVIWVPWVHKGTARAAAECKLVSINSAKMRTAVLEHKERNFVRRCAQAYLHDINASAEKGLPLSDLIDIISDESSQYAQVVNELPGCN